MAYLDPGTGSMLLQLILGGAAGVGMIIKLYWRKLVGPRNDAAVTPDRNSESKANK